MNPATYSIPHDARFSYINNELQAILENTVTEIVRHTQSTIFKVPSLCQIGYDKLTNLLTFELLLRDEINCYDEQRNKKEVDRFNHHFQHLQSQHTTRFNALYAKYCKFYNQYMNELQYFGWSSVTSSVEQSWVEYMEYLKAQQYYLSFNLIFVSCTKASYDPRGRICVVRFRIG